MKRLLPILLGLGFIAGAALPARAATYYVTVAGLGGEPDYEQRFTALANDLDKILKASGGEGHVFTLSGAGATKARLTEVLGNVARQAKPEDDFILLLIGHGSYDGSEYKFNLPGPDVSAAELAGLCDKVPSKRQLVIDATSASGGVIGVLNKPGRAVITATKSGTEKNATVFARYWVDALRDPATDVDKSDSITALEAFEYADRKTTGFYEEQKRLATEHPQFEDTGKGMPVRAVAANSDEGRFMANFTILRIGSAQRAAADPAKKALLDRKEELEQAIDKLKYEKAAMDDGDYKKQLTQALVELARVQSEIDK